MLGTVCSGGVHGVDAFLVYVECDISDGFPGFELVGSLSNEVRECKERVMTSLRNYGVLIPNKRITVNFSPANLKKQGTGYDLAVALSLLLSMGIIEKERIDNTLVLGELMLSGGLGKVRGVLPIVREAKNNGIKRCIVPNENYREAAVVDGITVISANTLPQLLSYLTGEGAEPESVENRIEPLKKAKEDSYDLKNVAAIVLTANISPRHCFTKVTYKGRGYG